MRLRKAILIITVIAIIVGTISFNPFFKNNKSQILVSTTTSLYESGVLDKVKELFEAKHDNYNVSFISQGTGLALQTAKQGDADLVLVHDPTREQNFLQEEYGVNRKIIAYNFFIIVGPTEDPANIKGKDILDALISIRNAGQKGEAIWVSRGDDSGTHSKEKSLWHLLELNTEDLGEESWYLEAGSGMTSTLRIADEKLSYTLTDKATFITLSNNVNLDLSPLIELSKNSLNVYSVIASNPKVNNNVNFNGAMDFIKFLISTDGQEIFQYYGLDTYGAHLFKPFIYSLDESEEHLFRSWVQELAYFDGAECPPKYRYLPENIYS